ncbi:hypothetical protein CASFOL_035711 [Castilleja foliolosa]|uniref:Protein kinase domain-containing protein n=1 Tax=Castilleja foliolosa TaxID=1961234 RepID=A0ABD3BUM5_9LAMI
MVQKSLSQPTEWLKGSVIGSGSFGTVHLAIDSSTGALFVAKSAKSEPGIKSLKNEADILEKLNYSPHIIKYMGKDVAFAKNGETRFSLFFEYMAGGSLSDVAQKFGGKLNEKLIRLYTREILRGLKHLHSNGIVHSDVKCKNVLLGSSGEVKLADFGCAKRLRECNVNGSMGGTPLWMAPEVLRNEGFGFAADIWSLGCTVIEMATGRPPWGGDVEDNNPMGVMMRIVKGNGVPEFPRGFSDEGLDFLSRCLERDPGYRWTSERLLDHPFLKMGRMVVSPTSVLDVASYEESDGDDDSDLVCDYEKFGGEFVFLEKWCFKEKKVFLEEGSDEWITVRSR